MKIEDYEKYWQKGGTYNLPIEILNELFDEIENWKEESQKYKEMIDSFMAMLDKNKLLLNNPDILDFYMKIRGLCDE